MTSHGVDPFAAVMGTAGGGGVAAREPDEEGGPSLLAQLDTLCVHLADLVEVRPNRLTESDRLHAPPACQPPVSAWRCGSRLCSRGSRSSPSVRPALCSPWLIWSETPPARATLMPTSAGTW